MKAKDTQIIENIAKITLDSPIELNDGLKVNGISIALKGKDGKAIATQICQMTNSKSRICFDITSPKGTDMTVKAQCLKPFGLTDKVLNRLYCVQYAYENPNYGKTAGKGKMTSDEIKAALLEV